jgi:hypothetical protein
VGFLSGSLDERSPLKGEVVWRSRLGVMAG